MSNPLGQPRVATSALGRKLAASRFRYTTAEDWHELDLAPPSQKEWKQPGKAVEALKGSMAQVVSSIKVPDARFAPSEEARAQIAAGKTALYSSSMDGLQVGHRRVGEMVAAAQGFAERLDFDSTPIPESGLEIQIKGALSSGCMASGGPHFTLGRLQKYLPRADAKAVVPTQKEVDEACRRSFRLEGEIERTEGLRLNPNADLGFPFGGKANEPETLKKHEVLREQIRAKLVNTDVEREYRRMMEDEPYLVALKGKAKYDFYTMDKIANAQLRFYNVVPGWAKLEMMSVTQPFEAAARPGTHTFQGCTLARGQADELIGAMDAELGELGMTWRTCGDDSFVAVRTQFDQVVLFALDCSSFDLTQLPAVTKPIHASLHRELARADRTAADLWQCFMRERLVTVSGSVTARMPCSGPSGMPLQSKVNDVLMQVALGRLKERLAKHDNREAGSPMGLQKEIERVGHELGLTVRLEQYTEGEKKTIRETLRENPFLFVGYKFWTSQDDKVRVFCDMPRMLKQLPYKTTQGWHKDMVEVELRSALKLAGVVSAMGSPPPYAEKAFEWIVEKAWKALDRLPKSLADAVDTSLLEVPVFAGLPEALASISGLKQAMTPERLRAIWDLPNVYGDETVQEGGITVQLGGAGRRPLAARTTQIVEPVGAKRAGRPPREARLTVHEARRIMVAEAKRYGGWNHMPTKRREKYVAVMMADDEPWETDEEEEEYPFFEDELDEESYREYLEEDALL